MPQRKGLLLFSYIFVNVDYPDQEEDCHWSEERFNNVIKLRQAALNYARGAWADFIFVSNLVYLYK